ncbi:MAG: SDR family NAD(P)-dependent oxidoreductase [Kofleriaceae bacterium]|nr:SDR family NAD(P)-dependent oxidoreductase [Kofleriaceae bacterium]
MTHILITGTSGSIGAALARAFRERDPSAALTLLDVSAAASEALAATLGGAVTVVACDLANVDAVPAALALACERHGQVHGLVNCAGFMEVRRFDRLPWARAEALLSVDLVAPLRLMHAVVPAMIEAGSGFVVNVASMAGKVTLPGCAFYGAAKAGLAMASEIARVELRSVGVKVVTVYPGAVASPLESKARDQFGRTLMTRLVPTGDPAVLARKIVAAVDGGRARVVYPGAYALGMLPVASPFALRFGPAAAD